MLFDILLGVGNEEIKEDMVSVLKVKAGYLAVPASIEEAITHLQSKKFDIALIDENFDGRDEGWRFAKEIKSSPTCETVKVIMLCSTYHNVANWNKEMNRWRENVDWILVYPLDANEILAEIDRQMEQGNFKTS